MVQTVDGGYALAGWTNSYDAGKHDCWLAKTNELGEIPEFSSIMIPAALIVIVALASVLARKKLEHAVLERV